MVALEKKTGTVVWKGTVSGGDTAGYASVVIANFGGVKQYVTLMANGLVSFAARTFPGSEISFSELMLDAIVWVSVVITPAEASTVTASVVVPTVSSMSMRSVWRAVSKRFDAVKV